jgi:DNA-damage-inducible protein J
MGTSGDFVFSLLQVRFVVLFSARVLGHIVAQNTGGYIMSENAVVRARIDEKTKDEASVVLAAIGLTISDAFRLMLTRIAKEKALPFDPLIPNEETIAAMKKARKGGLPSVTSVDALLADLHADD